MPAINREQFRYLLANANSLPELALQQMALEINALPTSAPVVPEPPPEEMERRLAEQFKHMDLSALDGLDWDPFGAALGGTAANDMTQDYSDEESLRIQADSAFDRMDQEALFALLARLPAELPPLTTSLETCGNAT